MIICNLYVATFKYLILAIDRKHSVYNECSTLKL